MLLASIFVDRAGSNSDTRLLGHRRRKGVTDDLIKIH
jgi:hypothetical protein